MTIREESVPGMMAVAPYADAPAAVVRDPVSILDAQRFERMAAIARVMAQSSLVPETLRTSGPKDKKVALAPEEIFANCFMVVNQAVRWGLDPFAVAQCCSIVRGKLQFEGKLVAAVLDATLGIQLTYEWNGAKGDDFGITVTGVLPDGRVESVSGTVRDWRTTGEDSAWSKASSHKRMLAYRGSREWARLFKPSVLLGIYANDEIEELTDEARARRAEPISLAQRLAVAPPAGAQGFDAGTIEAEIETAAAGQAPTTAAESPQSASVDADDPITTDPATPGAAPLPRDAAPAPQPAPPPSAGSAEERAGETTHAGPPSSGKNLRRLFSDALFRAQQSRSLVAQSNAFWEKHKKPEAADHLKVMDAIYALHLRRVTGEIGDDAFSKEIGELTR